MYEVLHFCEHMGLCSRMEQMAWGCQHAEECHFFILKALPPDLKVIASGLSNGSISKSIGCRKQNTMTSWGGVCVWRAMCGGKHFFQPAETNSVFQRFPFSS